MPPRQKAPHHKGAHQVTAKRVCDDGYANPDARCFYCRNTLDKCGPNGDGRNANGSACTWQGCHRVDGRSDLGYVLGCSHCNTHHGAIAGNAKRAPEPVERWP